MEVITNIEDIKKLSENKVIGNPILKNSKINFIGSNNILVCERNIMIENSSINFNGSNSIIYLCSTVANYCKLIVFNNSTIYLGKDNIMGFSVTINVQEYQNVIIGDDCILGNDLEIYTTDNYPIFNSQNKKRINFAKSVYIGDHVWLGRSTYVSHGVKIGSGSIISDRTVLPENSTIPSNVKLFGNPAKITEKNVFFTKELVGNFSPSDTLNSKTYISDVFLYKFTNQETLDLDKIDEIISKLAVSERLEFIEKLFIRNKRKNRFTISQ